MTPSTWSDNYHVVASPDGHAIRPSGLNAWLVLIAGVILAIVAACVALRYTELEVWHLLLFFGGYLAIITLLFLVMRKHYRTANALVESDPRLC